MIKFQIVAILLLSFSTISPGQEKIEITPIIVEGDLVSGVGIVESVENLAINDNGDTFVELLTDFANTDQDGVLVKNNVAFIQEGVIGDVTGPMGAFVDFFDSVTINNDCVGGFNFFIDPFAGTADSGLYIDNELLIQESDFSTAEEFSPETQFIGFFDAKINNNNRLMTVASIDDPAINSSVDRAIMIVDSSSQLVIAKEGDMLADQTELVDDIETGPHQSAFNDDDSVLFIAELSGDTSTDHAIYLDDNLIAQEGSFSPDKTRTYETLASRSLDMNNIGDIVFKANLSGDTANDEVIVHNNKIFKREGDVLANGFALTGFGSTDGPIKIGNNGSILWYGEFNDPNPNTGRGIFLNDTLIVQEGVSTIDGMLVTNINPFTDQFSMSNSGEWIIFEAEIEDGLGGTLNGAFAIQMAFVVGDINCDGEVNLLDVGPFVDLLSNGGFSTKADINGDGNVDLLDVGPLVALLAGNP